MNSYKNDRDKFAKSIFIILINMFEFLGFSLMTEDSSVFECIIKEMNTSQNIIDKVKLKNAKNQIAKLHLLHTNNVSRAIELFVYPV